VKAKPNLDIDSFRSADPEIAVAAEAKPKAAPAPKESAPTTPKSSDTANNQRANKTIRLRIKFDEMLKDEAHERSKKEGRRVTESDIIDEALERHFARRK
jgi:hypothetical protein